MVEICEKCFFREYQMITSVGLNAQNVSKNVPNEIRTLILSEGKLNEGFKIQIKIEDKSKINQN